MDAENDNDQPNNSSSASATSSNNSSSSNLLGNLPILPFMRSTDDDEQDDDVEGEDVGDGNDNNVEMNEEPMTDGVMAPPPPPPPPSSQQTNNIGLSEQFAASSTSANSNTTNSSVAAITHNTTSSLLPMTNPSQVIFTPFLFNNPLSSTTSSNTIQQASPAVSLAPSNSSLLVDSSSSPPSSSSTSSTSTTTSPSSSSSQSHNIAQQSLFHETPSSSSFLATQTQQHSSTTPPPPIASSAIELPSTSTDQLQPQQQEQLDQGNSAVDNIADTLDASAFVQSLVRNSDQVDHGNSANDSDIQLDNNDIDINDVSGYGVANVAANHQQHDHQLSSRARSLDSAASGTSTASASVPGSSSSATVLNDQQQVPTPLPLLLYQQEPQQQQQQQQPEEPKPPSYSAFDQHYHNPREYHLHSHPYQHPCVYPWGYTNSSTTFQQQLKSNGTTTIMFGGSGGDQHTPYVSSSIGGQNSGQAVDRLKMLYPNVNEDETPLPRCWSPHDKCLSIGLSQNNLRVHFKGVGKQNTDAASVRTAHPIPPACGIYYFEVKIISKGKNGYMGIGLTAQQFRMNRLPGWDKQSYGYHGDDGNSFSSSGHGQSYGPTFTTGDVIGCCVNFVNNTCFYTKNGIDLGIAFRDLPTKLYPTVGLQTPGEEVDANFGQEPFKFDQIEDMMKQMRGEIKATIYDFPLSTDQGDPTTLLQKMVNSYLVHNGYSQTAEAFARTTGQQLREDLGSIKNRQKILKLIMSGKMGQAIEQTLRLYPGLLENNKNLWFMLKCRQFIEMINGSDVEYCPSTTNATTNNKNNLNSNYNKTTNSTQTQNTSLSPNQTSVIQSTKSYQNGNAAAVMATASAEATMSSNSNGNTVTATAPSTTTSCNTTTTSTATNNAQNSCHITVINTENDMKTQANIVSEEGSSTISKCNIGTDNDYLNDVEMENNGHANGNLCKNGTTHNSVDADEEMDIDVSPSVRKYSHGIERILEFGKDLSQMGQQLEKESKMTDEERQMLEDAFSLIAYSNPWASPLGWQLCPTKRETVCRALNSAILESMSYAKWPPLEYCVAHANELLKVMAQASLGACAFVNIADVFPRN